MSREVLTDAELVARAVHNLSESLDALAERMAAAARTMTEALAPLVALAESLRDDEDEEPSEAELIRYAQGRDPGYDEIDHQANLDAGRPGL